MKNTTFNFLKKIRANHSLNNLVSSSYNFFGVKKKIKGRKNYISYSGAYLKKVSVEIEGDNNFVFIDSLSRLENCKVIIKGSNHKLHISKSYVTNTLFSMVQDGGAIFIGKGTTMGQVNLLSGEGKIIKIGENCMLSSGIEIRTTDSHSIICLRTNKRINYGENIIIGNHVWIGKDSKIWKGADIGNDSIIAFNSVVSKKIPANSIAKGIPAKISENLNVTWDRELT